MRLPAYCDRLDFKKRVDEFKKEYLELLRRHKIQIAFDNGDEPYFDDLSGWVNDPDGVRFRAYFKAELEEIDRLTFAAVPVGYLT